MTSLKARATAKTPYYIFLEAGQASLFLIHETLSICREQAGRDILGDQASVSAGVAQTCLPQAVFCTSLTPSPCLFHSGSNQRVFSSPPMLSAPLFPKASENSAGLCEWAAPGNNPPHFP